MEMTKEFDARNAEKSRAVCEAMAERADTGKRFLTERERRLLSAWPRHEGSGRPVWLGDGFADEKGELREVEGITLYSHGIDLYDAEGFHKGLDYGERLGRPAPVARDANGEPIHEGDTVYDARGERFTVTDIYDGLLGLSQYGFVIGSRIPADQLSISPRDSWERLEEDAEKLACAYYGRSQCACFGCPMEDCVDFYACSREQAKDIVRRAKALTGAEAGR